MVKRVKKTPLSDDKIDKPRSLYRVAHVLFDVSALATSATVHYKHTATPNGRNVPLSASRLTHDPNLDKFRRKRRVMNVWNKVLYVLIAVLCVGFTVLAAN
ncbi:MAG: hypothetical protein IJO46_13940, partial [Thermoguttaceae bacterium]|nr:hypothetical protein [Thermoguttaceae bacterium]